MKNHLSFLREASKFLAGIIAADLLFGIWMLVHGSAPLFIMGRTWSTHAIYSWMIFDALLFLFLIHYAWHAHLPGRSPRKTFLHIAGWVFLLVSVAHILRVVFGLPFTIGTFPIPFWMNAVAGVVTAFLAWTSFAFAARTTK